MVDETKHVEDAKETVEEKPEKRERVRPHPPIEPELVMDPMGPTPEN